MVRNTVWALFRPNAGIQLEFYNITYKVKAKRLFRIVLINQLNQQTPSFIKMLFDIPINYEPVLYCLVGKIVVLKLLDGISYKGKLTFVDFDMNLHLDNTEEYLNDEYIRK